MRKVVVIFTGLIMLLSFGASLAGALSYGQDRDRTFTTARGEVVEIADAGIYRYSLRTLGTGSAPWDLVWLAVVPVTASTPLPRRCCSATTACSRELHLG